MGGKESKKGETQIRRTEALSINEKDLPPGMWYESPGMALAALEEKIAVPNAFPHAILDVDDVTHQSFQALVDAMNHKLSSCIPGYTPIPIEAVRANGYWLDDFQQLQEAAHRLGFPNFNAWFTSYTEQAVELHAGMRRSDAGLELQRQLFSEGCQTAGYVTARPAPLALVTAASLFRDEFIPAPVVCRDNEVPASDYKARIFEHILPALPKGGRLLFVDDSISNVRAVCGIGGERVIGIVPEASRNKAKLAQLNGNEPFIYGDVGQIMASLKKRGAI